STMELIVLSLLQAVGISFLAFLVVYNKVWIRRGHHSRESHAKRPPEPPQAWPIIGHLHLLWGQIPACRTLGALADKLGPVFAIRLGTKRALIVSGWEVIKECFTTNDKVFLTRPPSSAASYMGYGTAFFGLGPYGPYWRNIRKISTSELLSPRRLDDLAGMRALELQACIKDLYSLCSNANINANVVDMSRWFSCVTMNTIVRMVFGKRNGVIEHRRFVKAIQDFMYLSGVFVPSDYIPYTEWLDFQGYAGSMKRVAKELDQIMSRWLEDHLTNRPRSDGGKEERDFVGSMLSLFKDDASLICGHHRQTVIKATALNLITASVDTTSVTMTWALSLLVNHLESLELAQEELDLHVGRDRWVEESDIKRLVYLQAIIKETLRLYPPGPLSVPRQCIEDCTLAGYYVPKGTILLVNMWKLHRDPRIWAEPNEFKPDRFLTAHAEVDVRGHQFEYIPFSSGRRSCPGTSSAMQTMSLTLARLLQGFNMTSSRNEPVDMTEGLGLTMPKAIALEVMLTPRLPGK
ncbi:Cytochrome P450, E-class, group I, partial [Trema orientale]